MNAHHTHSELRIADAIVRLESAIARRPGFGRTTHTSTTTVTDVLQCVSEEGDHRVHTDLGAGLGGDGTGPTPGMLLRAALGSCLAMGYRLRAARHGVTLTSIEVVVESDSAIEGMLIPDSVLPPGFTEVRYRVAIESTASSDVVTAIVDEADRLSPVLDAISRASRPRRTLSITGLG